MSRLVTIGIPVFQKERHLAATLDSALAQTHGDLEVVLCDNGSTDATRAICADYAARDRRVRWFANRQNLGSRRNFNLVFELARGAYFAWGRGHDLWHPEFVATALARLDADPSLVLCHTRCHEIDQDGHDLGPVDETVDTQGQELAARLQATWRHAVGPATLGLVRTAAMDRTRLYQDLGGCDLVFLLELAVQGGFAFVDAPLLRLRRVRSEQSEAETVLRTWAQLNPFRRRRESPHCHVLEYAAKHVEIVRELPVEPVERDALLGDLIACCREKYAGSFTRALDALADQVDAAAAGGAAVLDTPTALQWLEQLQTGLLFRPDHPRGRASRDALLHLLLDLTAVPETVA